MTQPANMQQGGSHEDQDDTEVIGGQDGKREFSSILRVKADPEDISPEERKRNVKKLAGAISHSIRQTGEASVRCTSRSLWKGAMATAIARGYVATNGLDLFSILHFIDVDIGDRKTTGLCLYCFTNQTDREKSQLAPAADQQFG